MLASAPRGPATPLVHHPFLPPTTRARPESRRREFQAGDQPGGLPVGTPTTPSLSQGPSGESEVATICVVVKTGMVWLRPDAE